VGYWPERCVGHDCMKKNQLIWCFLQKVRAIPMLMDDTHPSSPTAREAAKDAKNAPAPPSQLKTKDEHMVSFQKKSRGGFSEDSLPPRAISSFILSSWLYLLTTSTTQVGVVLLAVSMKTNVPSSHGGCWICCCCPVTRTIPCLWLMKLGFIVYSKYDFSLLDEESKNDNLPDSKITWLISVLCMLGEHY
ncbi:hypothetical protein ZWY2020_028022, partial [Hordeum vulgare]